MIHKIILFSTSEWYEKPCPWEKGNAKEGENQKVEEKCRKGQNST